jgi:hypothetical protein
MRKRTYTAASISFNTSTITDSFKRLGRFQAARLIQVSGSVTANNGVWEVVSVSNAAIVIAGALTTALAGATVTIMDVSDPEDDTECEQAIESASGAIETHCGERRFWVNGTDEDRRYSPPYPDVFWCNDDIVSLTTLATDEDGDGVCERTWETTDYFLEPANALLDGEPYTRIRIATNGRYSFPVGTSRLKLTGKFGWAAVPAKVKQATFIQGSRFYERRNSPFGVIATTETMVATVKDDLDPDVQILLRGLKRDIV